MQSRSAAVIALSLSIGACTHAPAPAPAPRPLAQAIIPEPAAFEQRSDTFILNPRSIIVAVGGAEADRIAHVLADLIGNTRETTPRVLAARDTTQSVIELILDAQNGTLGAEAYDLTIGAGGVRLVASTAAGLFYGAQTLRQLLPYTVEYTAALPRPMKVAGVHIVDAPRYEWRGAMLDVVRHFLGVSDVQRYIDLMALYKLNRLHLHLSDDQGWRIEIPAWPALTTVGGGTQVGGGTGGYYTQQQYGDIVAYARDRFITIVPEIDMPGHINAAMASYPELNCDSVAPPLYTGTNVGFSVLCVSEEITYKFADDVIGAIAAMTPGDYYHMGGDEVKRLGAEQYYPFVERLQKIVAAHGKRMIGWSEIALANLPPDVIIQSWHTDSAQIAAVRGSRVILSPSGRLYLDMQYDSATPLGLHWAGYVDLETAYNWEPAQFNPQLPDSAILGLEAPIWSETLGKLADFEYMAFPRLAAAAELAWSQPARRDWQRFRRRVLAHEFRWQAMGVNFQRTN